MLLLCLLRFTESLKITKKKNRPRCSTMRIINNPYNSFIIKKKTHVLYVGFLCRRRECYEDLHSYTCIILYRLYCFQAFFTIILCLWGNTYFNARIVSVIFDALDARHSKIIIVINNSLHHIKEKF